MASPLPSATASRESSPPPHAEQDLGKPATWKEASSSSDALTPHYWKGKGKSTDGDVEGSDTALSDDPAVSDSSANGPYPPIPDEEAESRRIQETLQRWEIAERQRRKAARESTQAPAAPSLMGDVTRRASLLWSGRKPRPAEANEGLGKHAVLNSRESIDVPLDDIATASSPAPSPTPTAATSPFADAQAQVRNPFMASSEYLESPVPPSQQEMGALMVASDTGTLSPLSHSKPPPPKPINIPPPRTPPPRVDSPPRLADAPPVSSQKDTNAASKDTRWWHDWLCGCSEGPDRGGDYQAGRTNPFE
ncbi:hypothetical protein PLEOSDRAFT_1104493 [Pleurotus ostreatus PC15]|uniref:Uncharacterized protein n=1 Tax=Pleurotus ostreatus (strain PC15) TaxID=1137138 RepID=A0A067NUP4_PLEO1|nr:hypothetical protein PLEOSDRAFT_1104493 [Pleurotus ostreatus PC15]